MFVNVELEERVLFGQSRTEAMAAGTTCFTGTSETPKNSTEVMISSMGDREEEANSAFRLALRERLRKL